MTTLVVSENTPLLIPPIPHEDERLSFKRRMSTFWEELRTLTKYALPVYGTYLLEYSLTMVSVISIGHLSTTALAAISLATMTANVSAFSVIKGFASALDTMLPSAWTSSQPELVGLWTQRMVVVMAAILVPISIVWLNAEWILVALNQDPEVARLAGIYLRWVSFGLPAFAFNSASRRYFQAQGLFAIPTRIIFVVAPLNVVLNYLLVWGPSHICLGFIGAPIATAVSFNLVSLLSIVYGISYAPRRAWHRLSWRMFDNLGVLFRLGFAGTGQIASEWWAWEFIALASSLFGPVALATQSVLLVSGTVAYQAPSALALATAVRIGNLLGEGKAQQARLASNTALFMTLALSATSSTVFLVCRDSWTYLFSDDPEVAILVASVLPLVALFQVFDGNVAVMAGILRARGKQVTGAFLNLGGYYMIGIPVGTWLAFSWDMKIHGLWIGLTVALVCCSVFGMAIHVRADWNHEMWKVMQRLDEGQKSRSEMV